MKYIDLPKKHYGAEKSPGSFKLSKDLEDTISKTMIPYLKENPTDKEVDPHLFEFFVYQKMYRRLERGLLCCNESVSYCDIDHDLIDDAVVDDVIFGNKTDIDIDMVTGDNHSLNQLNFVILDSIDVEYVPSKKNVKEATNDLFSVKPIDNYTGIIRPNGVIDRSLIKAEERGILRVLLS